MPKFAPRKSNASTPAGDADVITLAERLSQADTPRPFKAASYVSKLPYRTASSATSVVKKNPKQILILERERQSGGDGFLTASQTAARARGEVLELGGKKKKTVGPGGVPNKRGFNLKNRGSLANLRGQKNDDDELESGQTTPAIGGEEDEEELEETGASGVERKEVFTYHTPTAPPSLLPPKKYCDITGLHASYTDPRTKLRYKGLEVWHVVRSLGPGSDQAYLALRGAQTALK